MCATPKLCPIRAVSAARQRAHGTSIVACPTLDSLPQVRGGLGPVVGEPTIANRVEEITEAMERSGPAIRAICAVRRGPDDDPSYISASPGSSGETEIGRRPPRRWQLNASDVCRLVFRVGARPCTRPDDVARCRLVLCRGVLRGVSRFLLRRATDLQADSPITRAGATQSSRWLRKPLPPSTTNRNSRRSLGYRRASAWHRWASFAMQCEPASRAKVDLWQWLSEMYGPVSTVPPLWSGCSF